MSNGFGYRETYDNGSEGEPMATLSSAGAARRDSMLPALQDAVVGEAGRRRARRIAVHRAGALCLVVALGVSLVIGWPASLSTAPVADRGAKTPVARNATRIVRLNTKPGALERYAYVAPVDPATYIVDDHTFVAALAEIGRPTGLVRRGNQVILTSFTPDPIRASEPDNQSEKMGE